MTDELKDIIAEHIAENPEHKLPDVKKQFPDIDAIQLKNAFYRVVGKNRKKPKRITMDYVEKLILDGRMDTGKIRVMVDFLKIKQQDHSELQEIDLTLFYKKAMEE